MIYVIRKVGYEFNDYTFNYLFEGGIEACYDNYKNAHMDFRNREIQAFRTNGLYMYPPIEPFAHGGDQHRKELEQYLKTYLQADMIVKDQYGNIDKHHITVPASATDDQVWEIRRISGVRFYTLSIFDEPAAYILETSKSCFKEEKVIELHRIPVFFHSYEAAMENMGKHLAELNFNLYGTPEELSDLPALYEDYIAQWPEIFEKDEAWENKIIVNLDPEDPKVSSVAKYLFGLLKEPPLNIKKVNIDNPALWNKE